MQQEELERRLGLVRTYEEDFAYRLGKVVVNKPRLSIWLFLVPILLIYHFQEIRRFRENLPGFMAGFTLSKLRALHAVGRELGGEKVEDGQADAAGSEAGGPQLSPALAEKQAVEQQVLRRHYRLLLAQAGADYPAMLRGAYGRPEDYEKFLERLQGAEGGVYRLLKADLPPATEERAVIERMERESRRLRREDSQRFFSGAWR